MNDNTAQLSQDSKQSTSYVDDYQPPSDAIPSEKPKLRTRSINPGDAPADPVKATAQTQDDGNEKLEDQSIFFMLGVKDGDEKLQESFLNELQDVIWDDFLQNDVELLITSDEKVQFDSLMLKKKKVVDQSDEKIQNALIAYLETLIPDLEEIMIEKALDLKADLFSERIDSMKENHANNTDILTTIDSAEKMMLDDKWFSSAETLNKIVS